MADKHCMEHNATSPPSSHRQIQAGHVENSGLQFQLSLLRLMYPGSTASPQAAQLEHLTEPADFATARN